MKTNVLFFMVAGGLLFLPMRSFATERLYTEEPELLYDVSDQVEVRINPDEVENRIDVKLYGFLLEHIYHSDMGRECVEP